ncbi:hypothetical protein BDF21DRAFT_417518 [Thamnidium elegans]|nr:hypothetical protein BDF21DRAFT_417518 [Thamnidium elegans]
MIVSVLLHLTCRFGAASSTGPINTTDLLKSCNGILGLRRLNDERCLSYHYLAVICVYVSPSKWCLAQDHFELVCSRLLSGT